MFGLPEASLTFRRKATGRAARILTPGFEFSSEALVGKPFFSTRSSDSTDHQRKQAEFAGAYRILRPVGASPSKCVTQLYITVSNLLCHRTPVRVRVEVRVQKVS
ncbi:hypothetical protein BDZ97DRAFT_1028937 [Flammula alnicola]|nr:hypothetical protein BDZ97DRAFT_1028937 [Flammula alnicola]